jgi:hypothetical protein
MNSAAIDRIHQRLADTMGGSATRTDELRWHVELPEDPDTEDSSVLSFNSELVFDSASTTIKNDADLGKLTAQQATVVAEFNRDLATALKREGTIFDTFDEVAAFLEEEAGASIHEGVVVLDPEEDDEEGAPVYINEVSVEHEPWVSLSIPFVDDVDPAWLLEQNGQLTLAHFESFEGEVSLACAFPLPDLTALRLLEMVDDLTSLRAALLDELNGGEEEEDEEEEG